MDSVQVATTVIGVLGGIGGSAALVGQIFQRRKIRAETADVLTDTALTLVEPLQKRVQEVTAEAREAREETRQSREETRQAREEMGELRESLGEVIAMLRRWRAAVLNPHVTREELQEMVRAESPPSPNGKVSA